MNNVRLTSRRRGVMLVVSSPSGAGKTTLCDSLLKAHSNLEMSVSVTTRKPREGEINGVDYYFISREEFLELRANDDLLESAEVFGNFYGTPRAAVEKHLNEGKDILFDVDWQGAAQLSKSCGEELCRVFILPPSGAALEQRLRGRGTDSEDVVAKRMSEASREISHWEEYDYIIINDELEQAKAELNSILVAERTRKSRMSFLDEFVNNIRNQL